MKDTKDMASYIDEVIKECDALYDAPEDQYRVNENLKKIIVVGPENASE